MSERIRILEEQVKALLQALNDTRLMIEKLAAVSGLEFSQDAKEWADKQKLAALRAAPR